MGTKHTMSPPTYFQGVNPIVSGSFLDHRIMQAEKVFSHGSQ